MPCESDYRKCTDPSSWSGCPDGYDVEYTTTMDLWVCNGQSAACTNQNGWCNVMVKYRLPVEVLKCRTDGKESWCATSAPYNPVNTNCKCYENASCDGGQYMPIPDNLMPEAGYPTSYWIHAAPVQFPL